MSPPPLPDRAASAALQAIARLLSASSGDIRAALLEEAKALFGASDATLIALEEAATAPARCVPTASSSVLSAHLGAPGEHLLIVPLAHETLLLGGSGFTAAQVELAGAFGAAAGAALGRGRDADEQARQVERQAALTRAAKSLHESLDLETLLTRICREALAILDADIAVVYRGTPDEGLHVAATAGAPPEMVGIELEPGVGLAGKVLQSGKPMLTNDYLSIAVLPSGSPFERYHASLAIPFEWSEQLSGIISVAYVRPHHVNQDDLALLETFAELAAAAWLRQPVSPSVRASWAIAAWRLALRHAAAASSAKVSSSERSSWPTWCGRA